MFNTDNELLGKSPQEFDGFSDNTPGYVNVSRSLDWTDHGKTLRCVVDHIALPRPRVTTMNLDVHCTFFTFFIFHNAYICFTYRYINVLLFFIFFTVEPQPQDKIKQYGFVIGTEGQVNVTVHANPRPNFTWLVNGEAIRAGSLDNSQRLETSTAVEIVIINIPLW